jgi:hypothetical protein
LQLYFVIFKKFTSLGFQPNLNQKEINSGKSNTVSLSVKTSFTSLGVQNTSTAFKQSPLSTLQSAIIEAKTSLVSDMLKPAREKRVESPWISIISDITAMVGRDSSAVSASSGMYSWLDDASCHDFMLDFVNNHWRAMINGDIQLNS